MVVRPQHNTDGDINSTVQVNQDAGFSIVTDSPTNTTLDSIGHGLGVAPQVVIRRARTRVENWRVFHSAAGSTGALTLDGTAAYNSSTVLFTGVTSTTFGVGTDFSVNGNYNYISLLLRRKTRLQQVWQVCRQWQYKWSICLYRL